MDRAHCLFQTLYVAPSGYTQYLLPAFFPLVSVSPSLSLGISFQTNSLSDFLQPFTSPKSAFPSSPPLPNIPIQPLPSPPPLFPAPKLHSLDSVKDIRSQEKNRCHPGATGKGSNSVDKALFLKLSAESHACSCVILHVSKIVYNKYLC